MSEPRPEPTRAELHALLDDLLGEPLELRRGGVDVRTRRDLARADAHAAFASARALLLHGDGPEVSAARGITVSGR